ncbi:MAG: hypothetical protein Q9195_002771 [Heterodermia aff. obscurata]
MVIISAQVHVSAPAPLAIPYSAELEGSKTEPIISKNDTEPKIDAVQAASDRRRIARTNLQKLEKLTAWRGAKSPKSLSPIEEEASQSRNSIHNAHCKVNQPILHFSTYPDKFLRCGQDQVMRPTWSSDDLSEKTSLEPFAIKDTSMKSDWLDGLRQPMADSDGGCDKFFPAGGKIDSNHRKSFSEVDKASGNAQFDFNLQQNDEPAVSPRRNAWDWTPGDFQVGDIGIAVSSPLTTDDESEWLDKMDIT